MLGEVRGILFGGLVFRRYLVFRFRVGLVGVFFNIWK